MSEFVLVKRELLERIAKDQAISMAQLDQLRAVLAQEAGPVVERQELVMKLEAERLWEGDGEYSVSFVKSGWLDECRRTGGTFPLYTSPPAPAAVDEGTTSDKYRAELYDEVWQKARDMGFANITDALSKLSAPVAVADPCEWSDGQILDFLGVALRNVDLSGEVRLSEIRQGFEYVRQNACLDKVEELNQ